MKFAASLLPLTLLATPCFAQLSEQAGLSGEVSINAGYFSSESQFNTDGDQKTIQTLGAPSESDSKALILPLGNIAYTFGSNLNQQFYLGTAREDIAVGTLAFELGYKYQLPSGMVIDASFLPTVMSGETWQDPYQLGTERQTTDESGNAYRLKLENLAGTKFAVDVAYATKEIDQEKSGVQAGLTPSQLNTLDRNADTFYLKTDYKYGIDMTSMLVPRLSYIHSSAEGDAHSFTGYGVELSYFKAIQQHQFALTASYLKRDYDSGNLVFNGMTRDDAEYNLFAAYEHAHFLGWQNWSLISFLGYGHSDSNIDFYDEKEYLMSMGMNYHF